MSPAKEQPTPPAYWTSEQSGVLRPAIEAYLCGRPLTTMQIAGIRAYFKQWIGSEVWAGPGIEVLRTLAETIRTRVDIDRWVRMADKEGLDPL
jgi:hypothetical protein